MGDCAGGRCGSGGIVFGGDETCEIFETATNGISANIYQGGVYRMEDVRFMLPTPRHDHGIQDYGLD